MVVDRVLQNPVEKHRQLGGGFAAVLFDKLHHRILDDVEARFVISRLRICVLVRASLDFGEKRRHFLLGGQNRLLSVAADYRGLSVFATVGGSCRTAAKLFLTTVPRRGSLRCCFTGTAKVLPQAPSRLATRSPDWLERSACGVRLSPLSQSGALAILRTKEICSGAIFVQQTATEVSSCRKKS
jgi:hypothetical protein